MAAESELASLYVQFSARGSKQLDREIDSKRGRLMGAAGAAMQFGRNIATASAVAIDRLGGVARRALAVGTALEGSLIFRGLAGTQEANALSSAFTVLARVVADIFAPVIRGVTQGIIELARWILQLDPATKEQIRTWALWGAGIAATIALLPAVVAGIKLVAGAFTILVGAIKLASAAWLGIPLLIVGVGYALNELTAATGIWKDETLKNIGLVEAGWKGLKGGLAGIGSLLSGRGFQAGFEDATGISAMRRKAAVEVEQAKAFLKMNVEQRRAIQDRNLAQKPPEAKWMDNWGDAWKRIMDSFNNVKPLQVIHKVDVLGLDAVWQKMQTSKGMTKEEAAARELEMMRRDIAWIKNNGLKITNLAPAWV